MLSRVLLNGSSEAGSPWAGPSADDREGSRRPGPTDRAPVPATRRAGSLRDPRRPGTRVAMSDGAQETTRVPVKRPDEFPHQGSGPLRPGHPLRPQGAGQPLILWYGWPGFWWDWRYMIDDLAEDFDVIVPDLRGSVATVRPEGEGVGQARLHSAPATRYRPGGDEPRLEGPDGDRGHVPRNRPLGPATTSSFRGTTRCATSTESTTSPQMRTCGPPSSLRRCDRCRGGLELPGHGEDQAHRR